MSIPESPLNRRDFLALSAAGVGSGLALALPGGSRENDGGPSSWINVALIGLGKMGQVLFYAMQNIPGIHFQAVCDIWHYNRTHGMHSVRPFQQHIPNGYVDIDDMLATENGLDAAIIATPDFWHADHTTKCLKAGLHVYCEKMTGKLLRRHPRRGQAQLRCPHRFPERGTDLLYQCRRPQPPAHRLYPGTTHPMKLII